MAAKSPRFDPLGAGGEEWEEAKTRTRSREQQVLMESEARVLIIGFIRANARGPEAER
jgi:hypothetical protein